MNDRLPIRILAAAIVPILIAGGCATTTNPAPDVDGSAPRSLTDVSGNVVETSDLSVGLQIRVVGKPLAAVSALARIYTDMKIPIGIMNPSTGLIGNTSLSVASHRLAGQPLSTYLDCGQESLLGSRAELDDVIISVLSRAVAAGDSSSMVTTELKGWARPMANSSNTVPCQTNGTLEHQINVRLASALAAGT